MNRLVTGDLVHQTSMFLETHPLVIFGVAKVYKGKSANREEAKEACDRWKKVGKYDKDVEDFCLDVLARRIGTETTLQVGAIKWRIYGQAKYLPKPKGST